MNELILQQATAALVNARRQLRYRKGLVEEATRDLKNKTDDMLISEKHAALALNNLLEVCDEKPV